MAVEVSFGFISLVITILCGTVTSFKDGAPFDMCKYKGNAFHTAKYNLQYVRWIQPMEDFNEPSPYKLTVDKLTYRESVHRTINGKKMATSDMIKGGYQVYNPSGTVNVRHLAYCTVLFKIPFLFFLYVSLVDLMTNLFTMKRFH